MKRIIIALFVVATLVSCSKKFNYNCTITSQGNTMPTNVDKFCSEAQIQRFIKSTTVDNDGVDYILTKGEVIVVCVKK